MAQDKTYLSRKEIPAESLFHRLAATQLVGVGFFCGVFFFGGGGYFFFGGLFGFWLFFFLNLTSEVMTLTQKESLERADTGLQSKQHVWSQKTHCVPQQQSCLSQLCYCLILCHLKPTNLQKAK